MPQVGEKFLHKTIGVCYFDETAAELQKTNCDPSTLMVYSNHHKNYVQVTKSMLLTVAVKDDYQDDDHIWASGYETGASSHTP